MKDLDIQITEEGMRLLKGFIGQEFISMKHEKMGEYRDVFRQVMIETSNGRYLINNDVEGYADYFGGIDALPHLNFLLVKDGQDPFDYASDDEFSTEEVMETVLDVQVIRDHAEVLNGETHRQYMDASEGIIIITDKQQYGFSRTVSGLTRPCTFGKDKTSWTRSKTSSPIGISLAIPITPRLSGSSSR